MEVGEWLQKELGHFTKLQPSSLKKNLERYRAADLKNKLVKQATAQVVDALGGVSVAVAKKRLDAVEEMEKLVARQIERYESILSREAQAPKGILLKGATDEGRLLKEMLEKLGTLQLETGRLRRAPKHTTGQSFNPATGEVQQFSWTEEQAALHQELEKMDGDTLELEAVEDVPSV